MNNGEFTERGLARLLGVSQPQIHNVLKGARTLSPDLSDSIMAALGMSILDLLSPDELAERTTTDPLSLTRKPPSRDTRPRAECDSLAV